MSIISPRHPSTNKMNCSVPAFQVGIVLLPATKEQDALACRLSRSRPGRLVHRQSGYSCWRYPKRQSIRWYSSSIIRLASFVGDCMRLNYIDGRPHTSNTSVSKFRCSSLEGRVWCRPRRNTLGWIDCFVAVLVFVAVSIMEDSFTKSGEEVLNYFKTDENTGLTDEQVQRYQEKYGPNGMLLTTSFNSNSDYFQSCW